MSVFFESIIKNYRIIPQKMLSLWYCYPVRETAKRTLKPVKANTPIHANCHSWKQLKHRMRHGAECVQILMKIPNRLLDYWRERSQIMHIPMSSTDIRAFLMYYHNRFIPIDLIVDIHGSGVC